MFVGNYGLSFLKKKLGFSCSLNFGKLVCIKLATAYGQKKIQQLRNVLWQGTIAEPGKLQKIVAAL